jgi:hypothetical protein
MASSALASFLAGLRVECTLQGRAILFPLVAADSLMGLLFSVLGGAQVPLSYALTVPERLAERAFRVHGCTSLGSVPGATAPVAQVPPVLLGGACSPHVPNLQAFVALKGFFAR